MTRLLLSGCLLLLGLGGLATAAEPGDEGMVPLFDGKSFDGWKKVGGGASYTIEGDTIVGKVGPGSNSFLRTEKTYGDFVLKVDIKLDVPTNSGIQFRSHQQPSDDGNGRVFGYQCEIDPLPRAWSAGLYEEGRRGWLFPLDGHEEARKAFKLDDWNHFTIMACGPHLRTWLNGIPCADLIDAMDLEGFIALQVHTGKAGQIRFKNVRLKDLGESTWKPLLDGKTLAGWSKIGGGRWLIEDSTIRPMETGKATREGVLITDKTYSDFAVRLKYKGLEGNTGLCFRTEPDGSTSVVGLQAEISDRADENGGLFAMRDNKENMIAPPAMAKPKPAAPKKKAAVKDNEPKNEWTELAVVALGDRIVIQVDGRTTVEFRDKQGPKQGRIALQLPRVLADRESDVRFKDLEILPLVAAKYGD